MCGFEEKCTLHAVIMVWVLAPTLMIQTQAPKCSRPFQLNLLFWGIVPCVYEMAAIASGCESLTQWLCRRVPLNPRVLQRSLVVQAPPWIDD